jgi:hypothetical protein
MPGRRPVRADLHRRHRGLGHRQHEAGAERRADHRHRRRRQHRDPPAGGRRQHLHLRPEDARRSGRAARRRLPAAAHLRGNPRSRQVLDASPAAPSRPRSPAATAAWSTPAVGRRPLPAAGRLRLLRGLRRTGRRAVSRPGGLGAQGHANVAGMGPFSSDRTIREYAGLDGARLPARRRAVQALAAAAQSAGHAAAGACRRPVRRALLPSTAGMASYRLQITLADAPCRC